MDIDRFEEASIIKKRVENNKYLVQNYEKLINLLDAKKWCDVVTKDYNRYSKQIYIGNMTSSDCMLILRSNSYCQSTMLDLTPLIEDLKNRVVYIKEKIKDDEYKFNKL